MLAESQPLAEPGDTEAVADRADTAQLIDRIDWTTTPLGSRADWPPSLKTLVAVMLASHSPSFIAWGPERTLLYNDGYAAMCGAKHPWALGRPFAEVWADVLAEVDPIMERTYAGETVSMNDIRLDMKDRHGRVEETHFSFCYTPVRGDDGRVSGMVCVCNETTLQVLSTRRLAFMLELSDALRRLQNPHEIKLAGARMLGQYLQVSRVGCAEVGDDGQVLPAEVHDDGRQPPLGSREYWLGDYSQSTVDALRAGRNVAVSDVNADAPTADERMRAAAYQALGVRAALVLPLIRQGRLEAILFAGHPEPRLWPEDEVLFVQEVAERLWSALDQARAERRLRDSEQRLSKLFSQTLSGMAEADLEGRLLRTNPRFCQIVGRSAQELTRLTLCDISHPNDVPALSTLMRQLLDGHRSGFETEHRCLRLDGSWVWLHQSVSLVRDDAGTPQSIFLIALDQTAARKAQEALTESEARFWNMADNAPMMVWVTDAQARCTYLSKSWYAYTGQTPQTALGHGWLSAVHPDDREMSRKAFLEANARGEPFKLEYRLLGADGHYRWALDSASPRFGSHGELIGYIGSVMDITDRKRIEQALRASEQSLRAATAAADIGTWRVDLATRIDTRDASVNRLLGLEPVTSSVPMQDFFDRIHPDDQARCLAAVEESMAGRGPYEMECRIVRPDGSVRWMRDRGALITDALGLPVALTGACFDVTERHQLMAEREHLLDAERNARSEAERASRMKDEFLSTLSHELRTPLNAIVGWAHVLRSGKAPPERVTDGLEVIARNAQLQARIIEDLLDMSAITSGKVRLEMKPVRLSEVVDVALRTSRPAADAKSIELTARLDAAADGVTGDPNRLQQVLWNLLSNALKYTPSHGRVEVVVTGVGRHVELSVIDTGEGIAPELLPRVFERFRQGDSTSTRRHGGLGLGLAIVRQIVEMHGGMVYAHSDGAGRGATFTVFLPRAAEAASPLRPLEPARMEATSATATMPPAVDDHGLRRLDGVKVLVVDDERDARDLVKRLLEDREAQVTVAESAAEAIDLLRQFLPDVLVSDIGMPNEDGYALIRRVRSMGSDQGGDVPAIALTAYARAEDRANALHAGFQRHLAKPVEPSELVGAVARLAGLR